MHADVFLRETASIADILDREMLERIAICLSATRDAGGRLYLIGIGGSAANCSHAAADFRKLCGIRAVCLTDSVAEFSARTNDEGFDSAFTGQMQDATDRDELLVLSVGGGTEIVSRPITEAVRFARERGMSVLGIVGPDGGVTAEFGHVVLKVPAPGKHI